MEAVDDANSHANESASDSGSDDGGSHGSGSSDDEESESGDEGGWFMRQDESDDDVSVGSLPSELGGAAMSGDVDVLERCHEAGTIDDIDKRDCVGMSMLDRALTYGHSPDFVRKLVELGASVTRVSGGGGTPLHSVASSLRFGGRNCEIVKLLLDRGAQVNAQCKNGWTALMGAANHGSVDVVRTLLSRGADPTLRTSAGRMWGTSDAEEIARDEADENTWPPSWGGDEQENFCRRLPYVTCATILADVGRAGSWARYARAPRYDLLALRVLCQQGRAKPPSGVLARLFPNAPPADGSRRSPRLSAIFRPLPKEVFWTVLAYWRSDRDA